MKHQSECGLMKNFRFIVNHVQKDISIMKINPTTSFSINRKKKRDKSTCHKIYNKFYTIKNYNNCELYQQEFYFESMNSIK